MIRDSVIDRDYSGGLRATPNAAGQIKLNVIRDLPHGEVAVHVRQRQAGVSREREIRVEHAPLFETNELQASLRSRRSSLPRSAVRPQAVQPIQNQHGPIL